MDYKRRPAAISAARERAALFVRTKNPQIRLTHIVDGERVSWAIFEADENLKTRLYLPEANVAVYPESGNLRDLEDALHYIATYAGVVFNDPFAGSEITEAQDE